MSLKKCCVSLAFRISNQTEEYFFNMRVSLYFTLRLSIKHLVISPSLLARFIMHASVYGFEFVLSPVNLKSILPDCQFS